MATNVLEAKITGDVSGLKKALSEAERLQQDYGKAIKNTQKDIADNIAISRQYQKAIDQLNKELAEGSISSKDYSKQLARIKRDEKETQIETSNLRKELSRLKREQKDLGVASGTTTKGMTNFGKSTANATPTVIEFSRVIQDAPYGIQGVANNIQQLTTNFGYLQKQAGGTVPALKAFAGSFLGPAGIVFAVSTVTSLLVTYGDELLSSVRSTDKLADATREYLGEAQAEVSQLKALVGIASDEAQSKGVREQAIKKLNEEYGDYLGNLNIETINSQKAKIAVDELSKSLIRQAQIRGVSKLIEEKALELAEKEIEAKKDGVKQADRVIGSNRAVTKSYDEQRLAFQTFGKDYKKVQDSLRKQQKERIVSGTVQRETEDVKSEVNELISFLQTKLVEQFEFDSLFKKPEDSETKARIKVSTVLDLELASDAQKTFNDFAKKSLDLLSENFKTGDLDKPIINVDSTLAEIDKLSAKINDAQALYAERLKSLQEQSQIFANVTGAALGGFSTKLAETFSTGNDIVDASIAALIKSGEQLLQELIKQSLQAQAIKTASATKDIATNQAVATSDAIRAGSSSAAASGPAAAFLLPALIGAAVGFIAASFAGIKFATGGIVPGGSFNGDQVPAMLNSGEMVLNSRQQSNLFSMLDGNIRGLRDRSDTGNFIANTVIRGSDLLLSIEREQRKR